MRKLLLLLCLSLATLSLAACDDEIDNPPIGPGGGGGGGGGGGTAIDAMPTGPDAMPAIVDAGADAPPLLIDAMPSN
jgi:hypothetical protein